MSFNNNQHITQLVQNALHRNTCGFDVPLLAFSNSNNRFKQQIDNSIEYSQLNQTHLILFDRGNQQKTALTELNRTKNLLLKRNEIEHELSISELVRSPIAGHILERTSMCTHICHTYHCYISSSF